MPTPSEHWHYSYGTKCGLGVGLKPWRERTDLSWILDLHFPEDAPKYERPKEEQFYNPEDDGEEFYYPYPPWLFG